jgi:26S proteasome regulatory subunit N7
MQEKAITSFDAIFEKTGILGTKIDLVLAIIRIGLFFGDKLLVKKSVERATIHVEQGGDWDRRNRLKAYTGLHLLTVRSYAQAAPLLLDSLSTFTSYELCSYSSLVIYAILAGSVSLKRVDFKSKVVDAPEIKAIVGGSKEDRLSAITGQKSAGPAAGDEEMTDSGSSSTPQPAIVNLTTLGGDAQEAEAAINFSPLSQLVKSLYEGNYKSFFGALGEVETNFLSQDRYLHEHRGWYVREMRLRGYQQLLQSYRVVGLQSMANDFGVTIDFLDRYAHTLVRSCIYANGYQGPRQIHRCGQDTLHHRPGQGHHRDQQARRQEQAVCGRGEAGRSAHYEAAEIRTGREVTGQRARLSGC